MDQNNSFEFFKGSQSPNSQCQSQSNSKSESSTKTKGKSESGNDQTWGHQKPPKENKKQPENKK